MQYTDIVWQVLQWMLWPGTVLLTVVGIWALWRPQSFLELNRAGSAWVETRALEQSLSAHHRSLDRHIYRHHFLSGSLLILASLVMLYLALVVLPVPALTAATRTVGWPAVLYESFLGALCLAGILGLAVGLIVFVRPSSLKLVETWGNRWWVPQQGIRWLEKPFNLVDVWVERHTRTFGAIVLVMAGVFALLAQIRPF